MYLHVRILEFGQQARVSGRDSEPDRGVFFAQLAHSGYATGSRFTTYVEAHGVDETVIYASVETVNTTGVGDCVLLGWGLTSGVASPFEPGGQLI